jgi:RNA polymerase sigma factor, sigma-70 family
LRSRSEDTWFSREIEAMAPTMFRIAFSILRNRTDCEDASQNAVIKAYTNLDTLKERRYFRTWLIRILKNECVNYVRTQRPTSPLEAHANIGYEMEVPDLDLNRAFDTLSPDERLAITLYYYEGYSTKEIARICEVTDGAIRSRLSRAREALKNQLTGKETQHEEELSFKIP